MQGYCDKSPSSRLRILLRSGAVAVVLLFFGCASNPVDTKAIVSSYATMQVEIPGAIPVKMRPLESLVCNGITCTMSEADYAIRTADIQALTAVKQGLEAEVQSRARAYNEAITSAMHRDIAAQESAQAAEEYRKALRDERIGNNLKLWLERVGFALVVYVLSL